VVEDILLSDGSRLHERAQINGFFASIRHEIIRKHAHGDSEICLPAEVNFEIEQRVIFLE